MFISIFTIYTLLFKVIHKSRPAQHTGTSDFRKIKKMLYYFTKKTEIFNFYLNPKL